MVRRSAVRHRRQRGQPDRKRLAGPAGRHLRGPAQRRLEGNDLGSDSAAGPEKNIRSWGQAGLEGAWANEPIAVYGYNLQYLFAPRFSDAVLAGSGKWNERIRQFTISATSTGKLLSVDQQMAAAVGRNRYAIAYYSPLRGVNPRVRYVPIRLPDGRIVAASIDAVRDHSYPLYDNVWLYASRRSDGSLPAKTREFLSFILSREAQQEVNRDTTMLPLTRTLLLEQKSTLR